MIFWLVFEMGSSSSSFLSSQQYFRLKNVRTLEHLVFADDQCTDLLESEFVPLAVSKLVRGVLKYSQVFSETATQ